MHYIQSSYPASQPAKVLEVCLDTGHLKESFEADLCVPEVDRSERLNATERGKPGFDAHLLTGPVIKPGAATPQKTVLSCALVVLASTAPTSASKPRSQTRH